MNLEIVDAHLWTRGIELAWAVFTLYSRIIHEPYVLWRRLVGADADWFIRDWVDRGIAHRTFEGIIPVRVLLLKAREGLAEPFRRWWLRPCQYE